MDVVLAIMRTIVTVVACMYVQSKIKFMISIDLNEAASN